MSMELLNSFLQNSHSGIFFSTMGQLATELMCGCMCICVDVLCLSQLENGSHPMAKNSNKEAGYHLAAQEGYTGVLKLLVKGGYSGKTYKILNNYSLLVSKS